MKVKNITDTKKFFEVISKCKGSVELVTIQGDRLNLKSILCQYIALTEMFTDARLADVEIICSEPDDVNLLLEFMIRG